MNVEIPADLLWHTWFLSILSIPFKKSILRQQPLAEIQISVTLSILFTAKFHIVQNNGLILEWLDSREGWKNGVLQNLNTANFDAPNLF